MNAHENYGHMAPWLSFWKPWWCVLDCIILKGVFIILYRKSKEGNAKNICCCISFLNYQKKWGFGKSILSPQTSIWTNRYICIIDLETFVYILLIDLLEKEIGFKWNIDICHMPKWHVSLLFTLHPFSHLVNILLCNPEKHNYWHVTITLRAYFLLVVWASANLNVIYGKSFKQDGVMGTLCQIFPWPFVWWNK